MVYKTELGKKFVSSEQKTADRSRNAAKFDPENATLSPRNFHLVLAGNNRVADYNRLDPDLWRPRA